MDAENTERFIARAIAALPYSRPSAGFGGRVMAEVAAVVAPQPWQARVLEAAALIMTAWAAALAFVSVRLVYANLADIAALFIQPGGFAQTFNLPAAYAALAFTKLAAAVSLMSEFLSVAAAGLPAWYEIAAATVVCSAVIAAFSKSARPVRQGI